MKKAIDLLSFILGAFVILALMLAELFFTLMVKISKTEDLKKMQSRLRDKSFSQSCGFEDESDDLSGSSSKLYIVNSELTKRKTAV